MLKAAQNRNNLHVNKLRITRHILRILTSGERLLDFARFSELVLLNLFVAQVCLVLNKVG